MRTRLFVILVPLLFASQGCIFTPREPEPPETGQQDTWIIPNAPKDVFLNMASGFAASRSSNYERSLSASFTFIPRPEDEITLGAAVFAGWGKNAELQWLARVKGDYTGKRTMSFGDANGTFEDFEEIKVGEATFQGTYRIVVTPGNGVPAETYSGRGWFYLKYETSGWALVTWKDIDLNGNFPTSGYLRGTLSPLG